MGHLLLSGLANLMTAIDSAILKMFAGLFVHLNHAAMNQLTAPWMKSLRADLLAVAGALMAVRVAYEVITRYILWSEGTADPDGSVITKGILRMSMYFGLSATLAMAVINFGVALGAKVLAAPLGEAFSSVGALEGGITVYMTGVTGALLSSTIGSAELLVLIIGCLAVAVGVIAIAVTTAVRAVQFIVYILAAPFVALGQISPDGGVWSGWWKGLVILALTPVIQLLALKGMVLSLTGVGVKPGDTSQALTALLLSIGWIVLAFRGSHMLEQWAGTAHSGFGGMMVYAGRTYGGSGVQRAKQFIGIGKKV